MAKLWGGRFSKDTDKLVEDFHSSISFDQKLYKWDITGSKAHARMLGDVGVISKEEAQQIIDDFYKEFLDSSKLVRTNHIYNTIFTFLLQAVLMIHFLNKQCQFLPLTRNSQSP